MEEAKNGDGVSEAEVAHRRDEAIRHALNTPKPRAGKKNKAAPTDAPSSSAGTKRESAGLPPRVRPH